MKILVVYYSRTGTTKIAAEEIAKALGADINEIIDKTDRGGVIGYVKAGRDAIRKKSAGIKSIKHDPSQYDRLVIGTPVWVGTMAAAIRTYIEQNREKIRSAAFFSTQGSSQRQRVFAEMEKVLGRTAIADMFLATREVRSGQAAEKINEFSAQIKTV